MKNSTPSSEFEHEDKCPSCGSPCNIHTDLDANDNCNECRDQIDTLEMGQIVSKQSVTIPTAEEFCKKQTFSEEEVLDLMYYIRCNAIEVDTGWQINGGLYYTDKELLKQFKKK